MKLNSLFIGFASMLFVFTASCNITSQSNSILDIKYIAWQEDNYLWASGNNNLVRWDIQTKKSETFKNVSGMLLVDSENTLWVFDRNTASRFDGQAWKHFKAGNEFAEGNIFSFIEANGYIWLGTTGLSRYNQQNKSWEILFQTPPGPVPTPISQGTIVEVLLEGVHTIAPADQGAVWIGTSRGLTYWRDDFQQTWTNSDLDTDGVRCVLRASDNEAWVCTESGIGRWDGVQWADFFEALYDHTQLIQGTGQEVWAIGRAIGVARWDGVSWNRWASVQELSYSRVDSLLGATSLVVSTTDSNVWVVAGGIRRWDEHQWRTYTTDDGLNSNYINVLIQDPQGTLWAGTKGGINYYDPDTDRWYPFPAE